MKGRIARMSGTSSVVKRLADKKFNSGDYIGALNVWKIAEERAQTPALYSNVAVLCFKMQRYEESAAYWFKYLNVAEEKKIANAYFNVSKCYIKLHNIIKAGFYLQLAEEFGLDKDKYWGDDIQNEIESMSIFEEDNGFRVVSPIEKADFSIEIKLAQEYIKENKLDAVEGVLEGIPYQSKYYEESENLKGIAKIMQRKYEEGKIHLENTLRKNENNFTALSNLCNVYYCLSDKENLKKSFKILTKKVDETENPTEIDYAIVVHIATILENHKSVVKYGKKYLETTPYSNLFINFEIGLGCLNVGEYKLASKIFYDNYVLDNTDLTSLYYKGVADSLLEVGGIGYYKYEYELPKKEESKYIKTIKKITKNLLEGLVNIESEVLANKNVIIWHLMYGESEVNSQLIDALIVNIENKTINLIIKEILMMPTLPRNYAQRIYEGIINKKQYGYYGIASKEIYYLVEITDLNLEEKEKSNAYIKGYAKLLAYIFFEPDKHEKLKDTLLDIYYNENNRHSDLESEDIICAATAYLSYPNVYTKQLLCKVFKIKQKLLNEFIKMLKGE